MTRMSTVLPTRSALMVSLARAIGAREPNVRYRNPDSLAGKFFGPEELGLMAGLPILEQWERGSAPPATENRATLLHLLRARWCDDELLAAVDAGAKQVVILGAGLDTRLYRFAGRLDGVRCFEVDLPGTQEYKKRKIKEILGRLPESVTYAPIDFTRQALSGVLAEAGWKSSEPTFFLWEGVSPYLDEASVDGVLRLVASGAKGSRICFDYLEPRVVNGEHRDEFWKGYVRLLESWGEKFTFAIDDLLIGGFVRARDLRLRSDVNFGEIAARYFPEVSLADLGVGRSGYHVCTAEVG